MLRAIVRKLSAHEHIVRVSHSHTFHTTHELAHIAYLICICWEGGGAHAVVGGTMLICSFVALIGGE